MNLPTPSAIDRAARLFARQPVPPSSKEGAASLDPKSLKAEAENRHLPLDHRLRAAQKLVAWADASRAAPPVSAVKAPSDDEMDSLRRDHDEFTDQLRKAFGRIYHDGTPLLEGFNSLCSDERKKLESTDEGRKVLAADDQAPATEAVVQLITRPGKLGRLLGKVVLGYATAERQTALLTLADELHAPARAWYKASRAYSAATKARVEVARESAKPVATPVIDKMAAESLCRELEYDAARDWAIFRATQPIKAWHSAEIHSRPAAGALLTSESQSKWWLEAQEIARELLADKGHCATLSRLGLLSEVEKTLSPGSANKPQPPNTP